MGSAVSRRFGLPPHLFLTSLGVGLLVPFLSRLPLVPIRGWEWFTDYLPGWFGLLFFSAFNLIPAIALFIAGVASKRAPLAFWFALAATIGFLLWAHGGINLRSSSTAAIGLLFIPIYAVAAVAVGWMVGRLAHALIKGDGKHAWMAGTAIIAAVVAGTAVNVNQSTSIAKREAQFPIVSVSQIPLTSTNVYACCPIGRVEVLALDEFDAQPGKDLAVLGVAGIAILESSTYAVKSQSPYQHERCAQCVHMYPQLVANRKGGFLIATSNGLSDSNGRLLWENKATGFSKVAPVYGSAGELGFLAYHNSDRIDFHNVEGKILWTVKLPVESVGTYQTSSMQLPFAIVRRGRSREVQIYSESGVLQRVIPLPEWASNVQSIDWPSPGHLLVGTGSWFAVLDPSGKEVLRHAIQGTSFNPYHGPDGTAVRFGRAETNYLAVLSHGSSGYARSVLLVFDPTGHLVWQEELNKQRTILAVPSADPKGDVLLVGGMDGVLQYTLADQAASTTVDPDALKSSARGSP